MATLKSRDFDEHFRSQFPRLVYELRYIVGVESLARDIAQEAFIRQYVAWARVSHYDKPGAWVRRVALRLAFNARRRQARESPLDNADIAQAPAVDVDKVLDVRAAIAKLPDAQRAAVVLHYYRDYPVAEVARMLRCRESTAKAHLFKARSRLAELLVAYS